MHLISEIMSELGNTLTKTNLCVLFEICKSTLISTGKVTMLEISRTTDKSYRTIQRFFAQAEISWTKLNLALFFKFIYRKDDTLIAAVDETNEPKAGKHTHGLAHFFSNLQKKVVPSVAFMGLSIVSVNQRKGYPMKVTQVIKKGKTIASVDTHESSATSNQTQDEPGNHTTQAKENTRDVVTQTPSLTEKRGKGRPKGSKNKPKEPVETTTEKRGKGRPKGSKNMPKEGSADVQYGIIVELLQSVISALSAYLGFLPVKYLVMDGYFGNQYYIRLAQKYELHLISKLKCTAGLYLPYQGTYSGKGRKNKYGQKIDCKNIDPKYCVCTTQEDGVRYQYYRLTVWNKNVTDYLLNVVVIKQTELDTQKTRICCLFTTDLNLGYEQIVDYYSLRFQIEFNFRDAKQYFGLADFKNYKETQVTNAVNLSFFMCNFAYILINLFKERFNLNRVSILDLKAFFRAEKIGNEAINLNKREEKSIQLLNPDEIFQLAKFQSVNF